MKILSVGPDLLHADGQMDRPADRQTERRKDKTKLIRYS